MTTISVPSDQLQPLLSSQDDNNRFSIAALWLKDAMGFRSVNLKTLDPPSALFFYIERSSALKSLYSLPLQIVLLMAVGLHLLVPLLPLHYHPIPLLFVLFVYSIREALLQYVRPFRMRALVRLPALFFMISMVILAEYSVISRHGAAMICGVFGPLFLIDVFPLLRFMATAMILASITVLPIVLSIACVIVLFACAGHLFFSGYFFGLDANRNFRDITQSVFSMLFLMTTVNFPDVMMPNYHQNAIVFVFFALYLVLTLLMFAWLLASVYGTYVEIRLKQLTVMVANQKASLALVFDRIASHGELLSRDDFSRLMSHYRPGLESEYVQALYTLMDHDEVGYISKQCWLDHANRCLDVSIRRQKRSDFSNRSAGNLIQILALSVPVLLIRTVMIAFDIWLLLERALIPSTDQRLMCIETSIRVLQGVFLLEAIARLIIFRQRVLHNRIQQIDTLIILISSIGIINFPYNDYFQMLAAGRLINLIPLFKRTHSLKRIGLLLSGMLALTLSVFYMFAYIGELMFLDKITGSPEQRIKLLDADEDVAGIWIGSDYFDLNFNNFANALVTLFILAIVNNWHIITNGYIILTDSLQSGIFFVVFYFVTVALALNIGTGLIIEEFMLNRVPRSPWQSRLLQILSRQYPDVPVNEWVITKAVHLQLMLMDHIDSELLKMVHFKTLFQTTHLMPS